MTKPANSQQYRDLVAAWDELENALRSRDFDWETACLINYLQGKMMGYREVMDAHGFTLDEGIVQTVLADAREFVSPTDQDQEN